MQRSVGGSGEVQYFILIDRPMIIFAIQAVLQDRLPHLVVGNFAVHFGRTTEQSDPAGMWRWFLFIILVPHPPAIVMKRFSLTPKRRAKQKTEKPAGLDVVGLPVGPLHSNVPRSLLIATFVVPFPKLGIKSLDSGEIFVITAFEHCEVRSTKLLRLQLVDGRSDRRAEPAVKGRLRN